MSFSSIESEKPLLSRLKTAFLYEPPAGENPPYRLFFKNRYFRAFIYCAMCLANTLVYYGWQHFSRMLIRDGAYRWQCDESTLQDRDDFCSSQDNSIQILFQIGLSSEFIFGVVAGILLDYCGPWITALVGCLSYFGGWICLMYSSQELQMYIPGMILLAGAVNLIAFPALCLGDLFPRKSGLMISLVVAAQTTGTIVAPVMKAVWDAYPSYTYQYIVWQYLLFSLFPLSVLYLLSIPFTRNIAKKQQDGSVVKCDTMDSDDKTVINITEDGISTMKHSNQNSSIAAVSVDVAPNQSSGSSLKMELEDEKKTVTDVADSKAHSSFFSYFFSKSLQQQLMSVEYILFCCYYILQLLQYGYYPTTVLSTYGEKISDFQGYLLPTQGAFGVLFGLLVDITTTLPICLCLIFMMSSAYITALIRHTSLQYFTSILYVVSNAYIYTVKYTYVAEIYPSTHFGFLIGLMGCVSGVLNLINIPIINADNYFATCLVYCLIGIPSAVAVLYLYARKKKGINYKE